jgi:hypothetical protein
MEFERGPHVSESFFVGVAFADHYPLHAERVGDESI